MWRDSDKYTQKNCGRVKSHEVTATVGSEIPLIGGAGGLEGSSLSQKDV